MGLGQGNLPLFLLTHDVVALSLIHIFGTIVCGQDLPHGKPHPLPYQLGLKNLGGDPTLSVAFEDSPAGVTAAVAAGIRTVGMLSNLPAARLVELGCSVTAKDFTDPAMLAYIRHRLGKS